MKLAFAAASVAISLASPAIAGVSSSASVTYLLTTFQDLRPGDGINPSISFLQATHPAEFGTYIEAAAETGRVHFVPSDSVVKSDAAAFVPLSASTGDSVNQAAAYTRGTGPFTASVTGSASGHSTGAYYGAAFTPLGRDQGNFLLSPYTTVTFTARVTMRYDVDFAPGSRDSGSTYIQLAVGASDPLTNQSQGGFGVIVQGVHDPYRGDSSPHYAFDELRSFSFSNPTGATKLGRLTTWVVTSGDVEVVPVPEPATWASMLLGLGFLGSQAWRRQRRAQAPGRSTGRTVK